MYFCVFLCVCVSALACRSLLISTCAPASSPSCSLHVSMDPPLQPQAMAVLWTPQKKVFRRSDKDRRTLKHTFLDPDKTPAPTAHTKHLLLLSLSVCKGAVLFYFMPLHLSMLGQWMGVIFRIFHCWGQAPRYFCALKWENFTLSIHFLPGTWGVLLFTGCVYHQQEGELWKAIWSALI